MDLAILRFAGLLLARGVRITPAGTLEALARFTLRAAVARLERRATWF